MAKRLTAEEKEANRRRFQERGAKVVNVMRRRYGLSMYVNDAIGGVWMPLDEAEKALGIKGDNA